jgi:hypothetical protein
MRFHAFKRGRPMSLNQEWSFTVGLAQARCARKSLSNPLPNAILSILYKETHAGDDILALKMDETYRGAGRHLLWLIAKRKDEIGGGKHCDRNHASQRSGHLLTIDLTSGCC